MFSRLFTPEGLTSILLSLPGIILAITFHEIAHGYAAESMGDDTAKEAGRLSLNPLRHLDPIGLLSMVLFRFGWAKPVPVNPNRFRDRRKGIILVSLSGCLANFVLGFISLLVLDAVVRLTGGSVNPYLYQILSSIYIYNLVFGVFNLIPIPPLDGSQILYEFLPYNARQVYNRYEGLGSLFLLVLLFTGVIGIILNPVVGVINSVFTWVADLIFSVIP